MFLTWMTNKSLESIDTGHFPDSVNNSLSKVFLAFYDFPVSCELIYCLLQIFHSFKKSLAFLMLRLSFLDFRGFLSMVFQSLRMILWNRFSISKNHTSTTFFWRWMLIVSCFQLANKVPTNDNKWMLNEQINLNGGHCWLRRQPPNTQFLCKIFSTKQQQNTRYFSLK